MLKDVNRYANRGEASWWKIIDTIKKQLQKEQITNLMK